MKKVFFIASAFSFFLVSCAKEHTGCNYSEVVTTAASSEIAYLQSYIASNGITNTVQHPSGVFYVINQPGAGDSITSLCNTVALTYGAYKLGTAIAFDSYSDPEGKLFSLGALILGVQKTLPVIKKGGAITLYIEPSLAYGSIDVRDDQGNVVLPANSYIKFEIGLVSVQ